MAALGRSSSVIGDPGTLTSIQALLQAPRRSVESQNQASEDGSHDDSEEDGHNIEVRGHDALGASLLDRTKLRRLLTLKHKNKNTVNCRGFLIRAQQGCQLQRISN